MRVLERAEAIRKLVVVLQGAKLRFGVWIVVAQVKTAMRLRNAEFIQQGAHRLRGNLCPAIGVCNGLARLNGFTLQRLRDEVFSKVGVRAS